MASIDAHRSIQESAEIDEEDVFKEIEILKSLDQCAPSFLSRRVALRVDGP